MTHFWNDSFPEQPSEGGVKERTLSVKKVS